MKKFILTALIAVAITSSSFAGGVNVNRATRNNFEAEFGALKDVTWSSVGSFTSATFTLDKQKKQAFYDGAGNMIGTAHSINIEALPTYAKREFAKKYGSFTVKEAIEFVKTDDSAYFISAEKDGESVILMIADGQVSRYK
jgi:hypothetical protein